MRYLTLLTFVLSVSIPALSGCATTPTIYGPGFGQKPLKPHAWPDGIDGRSPKVDSDGTRH